MLVTQVFLRFTKRSERSDREQQWREKAVPGVAPANPGVVRLPLAFKRPPQPLGRPQPPQSALQSARVHLDQPLIKRAAVIGQTGSGMGRKARKARAEAASRELELERVALSGLLLDAASLAAEQDALWVTRCAPSDSSL